MGQVGSSEDSNAQDRALLRDVRGLFSRLDPTPADLVQRITLAITVQALHADLADLIGHPAGATAGPPTGPPPPIPCEPERVTTLTFATTELSVMLNFSVFSPLTARVDGYLSAGPAGVELTDAVRTSETTADDTGRFVFHDVARGRSQLLVHRRDARSVMTPAFVV